MRVASLAMMLLVQPFWVISAAADETITTSGERTIELKADGTYSETITAPDGRVFVLRPAGRYVETGRLSATDFAVFLSAAGQYGRDLTLLAYCSGEAYAPGLLTTYKEGEQKARTAFFAAGGTSAQWNDLDAAIGKTFAYVPGQKRTDLDGQCKQALDSYARFDLSMMPLDFREPFSKFRQP